MTRLDGKVAIVTGGSGRIGVSVATRLAREGAVVVIADRLEQNPVRVAGQIGGSAAGFAFDAADERTIAALVAFTVERFGRIDVMHLNHAYQDREMMEEDRTALDTSFALWDMTMSVNLRGHFAACKYAIPHMIAGGGGAIIHSASGAGLAGDDSRIAYGTSKAALIGFSRYIAAQHGKQGIRSNCIAPGLVADQALHDMLPDFIGIIKDYCMTPRVGVPEDIAAVVAFLASDEASFITGQCLSVDGGLMSQQPFVAALRAMGQAGKLA